MSSEYVKFLATNSGMELIEAIDRKLKTMKEEIRELKQAAQSATNAATSAANKADDVSKKLIQLQRDHDKRLKAGNLRAGGQNYRFLPDRMLQKLRAKINFRQQHRQWKFKIERSQIFGPLLNAQNLGFNE